LKKTIPQVSPSATLPLQLQAGLRACEWNLCSCRIAFPCLTTVAALIRFISLTVAGAAPDFPFYWGTGFPFHSVDENRWNT